MWNMGLGKLRLVHSLDMRKLATSSGSSCCFYSTVKRPAMYLYNSVTRSELFLIGVDHVSAKSAELVQNLIKDVKPRVVAVELCEERAETLISCQEKIRKLRLRDFLSIEGNLSQKIITFVIKNMYADLACTGLKPGEELRVAVEQGRAIGANISYIDQDINVTVRRAAQDFYLMELWRYWRKRSEVLRQYPNFYRALSYQDINLSAEAMLKPEALKEVIEMGEEYFPGLVKAIVHERNEVMVKNLREMRGSVVGVVGALHVQGMQKLWQKAELESGRERSLPII